MDISKVLEQLRRELEHLDAAIVSLERLQQKGLRRGRPPKPESELARPRAVPKPHVKRQARGGGSTE
ncbi:MAG: hypothetical protein JWP63_6114 [Candidatus Solibacter sp.]|jgi:hypothetical protein|nr:hypothetical protein [Candidatus Solibacter sp.]